MNESVAEQANLRVVDKPIAGGVTECANDLPTRRPDKWVNWLQIYEFCQKSTTKYSLLSITLRRGIAFRCRSYNASIHHLEKCRGEREEK